MKDYQKEFDEVIKDYDLQRSDFTPSEIQNIVAALKQEDAGMIEDGSERILQEVMRRKDRQQ